MSPDLTSNRTSSPLDVDSLLATTDDEEIRGFCSLPSSPLPQRCNGSSNKKSDQNDSQANKESVAGPE